MRVVRPRKRLNDMHVIRSLCSFVWRAERANFVQTLLVKMVEAETESFGARRQDPGSPKIIRETLFYNQEATNDESIHT
jgi:hypothetical protein